MKRILIIVLFFIPNYMKGQSFYELLSETLDSAYIHTMHENKNDNHILGYAKFSMPYRFRPRNYIEERTFKNKKIKNYFLYNYDAHLGKDTIMILTHITKYDKPKLKENIFAHNFSKLKWKDYLGANAIGIKYILRNNVWLKYNIKDMTARWYVETNTRKRQRILDLNNEALLHFLECISMKYKDERTIVIENTLGIDFFLWEYNITHFPYMVASQEDLTRKVLKKYKTLVGWCSIDLNGNTISIQLRAVDSEKYKKLPDKENIDDAVIYTQTYQFKYCDEHGKWCMVK